MSPPSAPPTALDTSPHHIPPTHLTAGIPGIGGVLRKHIEDFIVEEIPAYQPAGAGEHIYLFVQKHNLSTSQLVGIIAQHFGVSPRAVGYAGLKDKRAVTRQVISIHVPGKSLSDYPSLQHERVQVLWADMHANKLRRGHLKGNRFAIKVRGVQLSGVLHAKRTLDTLARLGVPNRAGEQRFGFFHNNHLVARHLILGDYQGALNELLGPKDRAAYPAGHFDPFEADAREAYARGDFATAAKYMPRGADTEAAVLRRLARGATPEQAAGAITDTQRAFFVSAFQSAVFNAVLDRRMAEGTFARLLPGDLAIKHDNGAVFAVDEATIADASTAQRLESLAISPSGPNWGATMMRAGGDIDRLELDALHAFGLSLDALAAFTARTGDEIPGDRRALRVPLTYPDVEAGADEHGLFIRCGFELPAGAFATTVMHEVMKPPTPPTAGLPEAPAEDAQP